MGMNFILKKVSCVLIYSDTMSRPIAFLAPFIGEDITRNPIGLPDTDRGNLIKGRGIKKPAGNVIQLISIIFKLITIMMVIKKVLNINYNNMNNSKFREEPRAARNRVKLTSI